jgi:hypothetical protein
VSGKVLDIENGKSGNGTAVMQWSPNYGDNQKFYILPNDDGWKFVSKKTWKSIDVNNFDVYNGALLQQWDDIGSEAQKFYIRNLSEDVPNQTCALVISKDGKDYALDIIGGTKKEGRYVQIWEWDRKNKNQWFKIERQPDSSYIITSAVSGWVLDVAYDKADTGTPIFQCKLNGGNNQRFYILPTGGGWKLVAKNARKSIDVHGGNLYNGALLQIYDDNGSAAQRFNIMSF